MRMLTLLLGLTSLLAAAEDVPAAVRVTHTERADFPAGGWLRLRGSSGEVTVEGWDRPNVEITTIKSTRLAFPTARRDLVTQSLEQVRITLERPADGLILTTQVPRHRGRAAPAFDLEYRIKLPFAARLSVDHGLGEVHVDHLTADISIAVRRGDISLRVPPQAQYGVEANSRLGSVVSDIAGQQRPTRWRVGHRFVSPAAAGAHLLKLSTGYGDITILRAQSPVLPAAPTAAPTR